jgi:predicted Zn-dependent protease
MNDAELLELAERALAATGGDAQATVTHRRVVAAGCLEERLTVAVACARDGRIGRAVTTGTDGAALAAAAAAAEAACASDPRAGYPGFPPPAAGRPHDGWDPAVARLDPAEAAGLAEAAAVRTAIASATGTRATERRTRVVAADGTTAPTLAGATTHGSAHDAAAHSADDDPSRGAAPRTPAAARSAATLAAGEHRAVLAPAAVAVLLDALGRLAFNGLAFAEGRSPLCGRLGTRVAASAVNLSESPRFAGTLPRSYDAEGVPVVPVPLIQDGVAHRVVHDTRSAALAGGGAVSTGHAGLPGGAPAGPHPRNLVLVGGGAQDEAELLAPVETGVYVAALRDLHVVDPAAGVVSALIEGAVVADGRATGPLAPGHRFTGSPLDVLAAVEALTMRQRLAPSGTVCPALRAGALRVAPG